MGQKGKGKGAADARFGAWISLGIQTARARTHDTKRFPGYGGLPKGELTPPNLRYITNTLYYIYIYIYNHENAALECFITPPPGILDMELSNSWIFQDSRPWKPGLGIPERRNITEFRPLESWTRHSGILECSRIPHPLLKSWTKNCGIFKNTLQNKCSLRGDD